MFKQSKQGATARQRTDTVSVVPATGRRLALSPEASGRLVTSPGTGFTLIELVMTISVMAILATAAIPLIKLAVRRQKEQQLRETLRTIRGAIDEFHRDTVGMVCTGGVASGAAPGLAFLDPRSKVVISDCTVFGVDNIDRYPPDLDTLVNGINVASRTPVGGGAGLGQGSSDKSTLGSQLATKKKVYLRAIPIDPITGKQEWDFRSCYDGPDVNSWGGENVFDVRSKSKGTALNGEKYSDW